MLELNDSGDAPTKNGMYVAFVNPKMSIHWAERMLLMFIDGKWGYRDSDQNYRQHVYGWIGPLPAMRLEN